ncbi:MAG: dTDP-4-dehydrorhamnose reductase [Desulfamplus sp.]|nr:dTDP-4-dehydrorhamnose reductase [Desulfamplus sp.]
MKILLCGNKGQLGWDCRRVFEKEHELHLFDLPELDITDKEMVLERVSSVGPDVVINCSAYTMVDRCENDEKSAFAVNAQGPENLALACVDAGALLVHISTDYVFDGTKEPPESYCETDIPNPLSVYGRTKLEGERRIAGVLDNHIIVRSAWLYGIGGGNFLKTMLGLALKNPGGEVRVVNDQFGSPTWTLRLALQLERLVQMRGRGIYHATSEGYCSWYELAVHFLKLMDIPFNVVPCSTDQYPTPAHRPANSILDNARLKKSGNNLMTGWRYGVENFVSRYHRQLMDEAGGGNG